MKHKGKPANQRKRSPNYRAKRRAKRLRRAPISEREGPAFIARRSFTAHEGLTVVGGVTKPRGLIPWLGRK